MKFVCLMYADPKTLESLPEKACQRLASESRLYGEVLARRRLCVAGEALQCTATATTLRMRAGKLEISDGPFAETAEQLIGFLLLEADGLHEALHLAANIPAARVGSIEVRPVCDLAAHSPTVRSDDLEHRWATS
ncbi:YciI family protein [Cupriavidus respiraculi]|uniref:YciI family protein n=1 Tax=Cupriavidus respiraculi TaxID=195930 RepID=UPI001C977D98|nr:YciI family protein [Cupriavidus respiraculi]MBY4945009.1 YciI family protein [Cupriavidus respiraculi]